MKLKPKQKTGHVHFESLSIKLETKIKLRELCEKTNLTYDEIISQLLEQLD